MQPPILTYYPGSFYTPARTVAAMLKQPRFKSSTFLFEKYRGQKNKKLAIIWGGQPELNRRPPEPQSDALTN